MPFDFRATEIDGLMIIQPRVYPDARGFFMETFKESEFAAAGIDLPFVQDNFSRSSRGVVRGLHFQTPPHSQGKLVRCVRGAVWDVAVDLRKGSATFGQWHGEELSEENKTLYYLPPGFAHGFVVLSESADFFYKVTAEYAPDHDGGIRWNDPDLAVGWPIDPTEAAVSTKDAELPLFADLPLMKQGGMEV